MYTNTKLSRTPLFRISLYFREIYRIMIFWTRKVYIHHAVELREGMMTGFRAFITYFISIFITYKILTYHLFFLLFLISNGANHYPRQREQWIHFPTFWQHFQNILFWRNHEVLECHKIIQKSSNIKKISSYDEIECIS